ncbi:hypothetical protein DH2020_042012 [Rehmannia glutinosa]|uniref:Transcription repressor n=1 Tax=Rehmannia glutinosa TaxID=99300 RepID=A0ABR0UQP3_REHGL
MKCGGKRFSPSASRASIISRVFQVSCFSQFKPKGDNPETNSAKKQHRGKLDFPTQYSSSVTGWKETTFYSVDDDDDDGAYWSFLFHEERTEAKTGRDGINPLWNNPESQTKSACISRKSHCRKTKQKNRAKDCSPKTECRIRVLQDTKKERTRLQKKETNGRTIYDSFAEVKSSFNPQQDFRDSMVEMISEKGITRSDELEELLACYLTLNCDGYHELIIKVFRQVCFELSTRDAY